MALAKIDTGWKDIPELIHYVYLWKNGTGTNDNDIWKLKDGKPTKQMIYDFNTVVQEEFVNKSLKFDFIVMFPSHDPIKGAGGLDILVENNNFLNSIPHPIKFLERTRLVKQRTDTKDWSWERDLDSIIVNSLGTDKMVRMLVVDDMDTKYCSFGASRDLIKKKFPNCVFEWLTIYHNHAGNEK